MTKTRKIGEIASIRSGYSFRSGVSNEENGSIGVIQAKDVRGLYIDEATLPLVSQAFDKERLLNAGDVLLSTRGSFRAAVYSAQAPAIASSALLIIRLADGGGFVPEFVATYLNSSQAQSYLVQNAKGATIQSIRIDDMNHLSVPLLSVDQQKLIASLQQNTEAQSKLLESKAEIINDIFKGSINQVLEGATK